MPPKKVTSAQMEEDVEDIRKSLSMLMEEMAKVTVQLSKLTDLVSEVKQLRHMLTEKDKTISELEIRIDNLEQYTRMEDVIITGLNVKPHSYASAVRDGRNVAENAGTEELQTLERQVLHFFAGKDIHLEESSIATCHTLPRRDKLRPAVILRFINRKYKTDLLRQGKKLKGSEVYVNEHLTKRTAEIAREARILRRNNKIRATWTRNCKVYIQLNGSSPENSKVILVRDLKDLEQFK